MNSIGGFFRRFVDFATTLDDFATALVDFAATLAVAMAGHDRPMRVRFFFCRTRFWVLFYLISVSIKSSSIRFDICFILSL